MPFVAQQDVNLFDIFVDVSPWAIKGLPFDSINQLVIT